MQGRDEDKHDELRVTELLVPFPLLQCAVQAAGGPSVLNCTGPANPPLQHAGP